MNNERLTAEQNDRLDKESAQSAKTILDEILNAPEVVIEDDISDEEYANILKQREQDVEAECQALIASANQEEEIEDFAQVA